MLLGKMRSKMGESEGYIQGVFMRTSEVKLVEYLLQFCRRKPRILKANNRLKVG